MNNQNKINELEKLIETIKTNTEENINKLTEEINKLKEIEKVKKDKIEVTKDNCLELSYPKQDEIYYLINNSLGEVDFMTWDNYSTDIVRLSMGNVFTTEEEAKLELQYRLLSAKIMAYAKLKGYLLGGEKVRDSDIKKHFIYYDIEDDEMYIDYRYSNMINGTIKDLYINSFENAKEIIEVFKDELLEYCRAKWGSKGE